MVHLRALMQREREKFSIFNDRKQVTIQNQDGREGQSHYLGTQKETHKGGLTGERPYSYPAVTPTPCLYMCTLGTTAFGLNHWHQLLLQPNASVRAAVVGNLRGGWLWLANRRAPNKLCQWLIPKPGAHVYTSTNTGAEVLPLGRSMARDGIGAHKREVRRKQQVNADKERKQTNSRNLKLVRSSQTTAPTLPASSWTASPNTAYRVTHTMWTSAVWAAQLDVLASIHCIALSAAVK